jgi:phage/plasmid-like protein (TIGR03299 family)
VRRHTAAHIAAIMPHYAQIAHRRINTMSHNIGTMNDGRATMAFRGDRNDIWHRLGQQCQPGWTVDDWATNSGLAWTAEKVPALADLSALNLSPSNAWERFRVENRHFIARSDNGHILSPGTVTDIYKVVQPKEALDFFQQYVSVDDRFAIDTAMCLKSGEIIAATAVFNGDTDVVGEKHRARLLMTTTFDGSGATIAKATMTRVVCNNTLNAALADGGKSTISIRHNTKFNPDKVGKELAQIASGFAAYKAMGEAMAARHFSDTDVAMFFKMTLDIDPKSKRDEISARKYNQFEELVNCYHVGTRREGLEARTGWAMLQGVTRYADHNRSVKGSNGTPDGIHETRFVAANFGAGQLMKAHAVQLLDEMSDGELLKAVSSVTPPKADRDDAAAFAAFMNQPFKPTRG